MNESQEDKSNIVNDIVDSVKKSLDEVNERKFEIPEHITRLEIDENTIIPPVQTAYGIAGVPVGTLGNVSCWMGKPKSRKTFGISMVVAALIANESVSEKIYNDLPQDKKVIVWIDTEQGLNHAKLVFDRVRKQSKTYGTNNRNLRFYALRGLSEVEMIMSIFEIINNVENIGMLVIDGVADLLADIMDFKEGKQVMTKLMKWSKDFHIHILTVIHETNGEKRARGHIGTALAQKCETTLSVTRSDQDSSVSIISSVGLSRGFESEDLAFEIDGNGFAVIATNVIERIKPSKKPKYSDFNDNQKKAAIYAVFGINESIHSGILKVRLRNKFIELHNYRIADNNLQILMNEAQEYKWLSKDGNNKSPYKINEGFR